MQHILSAGQFNKALIDEILESAAKMEKSLSKGNVPQKLTGKIIACLFFEPSTRTRLSFETAALRLGAQVIDMENGAVSSSSFKGESIPDTTKIVSGYADLIVMRHPQDGSAEVADRRPGGTDDDDFTHEIPLWVGGDLVFLVQDVNEVVDEPLARGIDVRGRPGLEPLAGLEAQFALLDPLHQER